MIMNRQLANTRTFYVDSYAFTQLIQKVYAMSLEIASTRPSNIRLLKSDVNCIV
jgi:hypothetical protein